jgi:hypothetical protein
MDSPTILNLEELVGSEVWDARWDCHRRIVELLSEAQSRADHIRDTVKATYLDVNQRRA